MSPVSAEAVVWQAALAWPEDIGWRVAHSPDIALDMPAQAPRALVRFVV